MREKELLGEMHSEVKRLYDAALNMVQALQAISDSAENHRYAYTAREHIGLKMSNIEAYKLKIDEAFKGGGNK